VKLSNRNNNKETDMEKHYSVTFISDHFTMTVVASVPARDDDDPAYSDDPSVIDVAGELVSDFYGFDPRPYAYDVNVEPAF
jgi:hypothetical protein